MLVYIRQSIIKMFAFQILRESDILVPTTAHHVLVKRPKLVRMSSRNTQRAMCSRALLIYSFLSDILFISIVKTSITKAEAPRHLIMSDGTCLTSFVRIMSYCGPFG